MREKNKSYCVVYFSLLLGQWNRSIPTNSEKAAKEQKKRMEGSGYVAMVYDVDDLNENGLPEVTTSVFKKAYRKHVKLQDKRREA